MTMLMLIPLQNLSKEKRFDGSTVRQNKDGLISIVIPFAGLGEAIQGQTEDNSA